MQRIAVEGKKLLLGLTQVALSALGSIARDLLLKRVEIQHQVRYICTSIHMIMMENLLLMSVPELSMKDIKKYYGKNHSLRLILINVKHITKLLGEQGREEYMVLDLKHKVIMGRILASILDLMLRHQHHLQRLNKHRQKIWRVSDAIDSYTD
ncbi:uncharacterized protein LOC132619190 [Lycium barbarum]|uniref:uncharacterized protein LOC132619190 n=1 Tax=Lycium barbarum TaxID=112863 RepID=UPI00293E21D9|nr:uncharacterized protein LOC132619190 [Lycium barbarum]